MVYIFNLVYQSITLMYQNSFCSNFSFTIVSNVHILYTSEVSIQNNTRVFIYSYSLLFSLELKKERIEDVYSRSLEWFWQILKDIVIHIECKQLVLNHTFIFIEYYKDYAWYLISSRKQ